ncbi:Cilia- and flagella-associated protein 44 [Geranomyces michiganensis]|nr:Cilia- and flagella-associated protein 44 [Geranomyces michiganensis]
MSGQEGLPGRSSADNQTTSTKRTKAIGDPIAPSVPLPSPADAIAVAGAGQVGDAVEAAKETDPKPHTRAGSRLTSLANVVSALPDDYFYDPEDFQIKDLSTKQMPGNSLSLFYNFGFESNRRNNIHFLNEHIIVTAVGNVLAFINVTTMEQTYMPGLRDGAIGSIAVHPSREFIAVGESCDSNPNIYIFAYPSLRLYRVLREGAEKGFSNLSFNTAGDKLASIGMDPDYMLTIWDWKREAVILRSKAFSQDIFQVAFSPETDGQLTTSGMGHIKFWRMASTFTGLKLQGYIGKFGLSELTDIVTFIQLPDGKVLSSTETGNLLLWDGGMIKCELATKGKKPCHQGAIEVITLIDGEVFTAGEDGYVRIWDLETIDSADVVSDSAPVAAPQGEAADGDAAPVFKSSAPQARVCEIEPLDAIHIGKDVKIKSMIRWLGETPEFLIQDRLGHLFKLDIQQRGVEKIMSFHAGGVASVDSSPASHSMASLGSDGALKLYDYITKTTIATAVFPGGGTTMSYLPESLDRYGCTLAAGFGNGVLRIISHTATAIGNDTAEFKLQFVFKPHSTAITSIAVSADGTHLATASVDKTIFFFKIDAPQTDYDNPTPFSNFKATISPLGFITLDSVPVRLSFSPDNHMNIDEIEPIDENAFEDPEAVQDDSNEDVAGKRAFVVLDSGQLMALIVPEPSAIDNTLSFELINEAVKLRQWKLEVPAATPVAKLAPKEETGPPKTPGDASSASTPATAEPKTEIKSDGRISSASRMAHGLVIDSTSPVTDVMYLEGGYFLLSLLNKDGESEIRACKFGTPKQSRLVLVYKAKFSDMRLSTSGKYLLAGAIDGMSCLRKFRLEDILLYRWTGGHEAYTQYSKAFEEEEAQAAVLRTASEKGRQGDYDSRGDLAIVEDVPGQYWFGHAHSSTAGKVTGVAATFDDSFFFTAGADGGLFVWRVVLERIKSSAIEPPAEPAPVGDVVADILEPNAYALQDAKIKSEKDKELEDAERKKQITRQYLKELRNEFLKLVGENEKAAADGQLPRSSLTVDPDLRSDIEKETEQKIVLVRKELEWISAKESVIPTKLRKKFLDPLQTERLEVKSFRSWHAVTTFRTIKPEQSLDVVLQPLGNAEVRSSRAAAFTLENPQGGSAKDGMQDGQSHENASQANKATKGGDVQSKLEARKQLRAQRAVQWKELMDAKPDESYEDPRDVAAIRYAEQNMGDYKLKTGEKYIVPESERVDADKKRRQILLLKESVFSLKENFNGTVLAIRDRKKTLVQEIREANDQLNKINSELATLDVHDSQKIWTPTMEDSAYPEKRYEVTPDDIAQLRKQDKLAVSETKSGGEEGGFGGFGGGGAASKEVEPAKAPAPPKSRPTSVAASSTNRAGRAKQDPLSYIATGSEPEEDETALPYKSAVQLREEEMRRQHLIYQRDHIHTAINGAMDDFDRSLHSLVKEKVVLEGDLKSADIKLLLLYREWVLLKEFEKHDNALADKLVQKRSEKNDIDTKIKECQEKLNGKKADVETIIKKEKDIQEEFRQILGENNKHEEFLTKLFKKKVKRTKKKPKTEAANEDGEDAAEEEDEDEDDDDMDDLDEEESMSSEGDGDDVPEECPNDYDASHFARILALREERLDQEDILVEIQKAVDVLKKENDALIKKEKISDQALRTTENEIQEFQTQKQRKLNELDVVVPLRLHQLQYLEKGALPSDLSGALVFMNQGLVRLRRRIKELQQEKADIRRQHKELRRMHVSLIKSRKEKQAKLQELEARAVDVQMLKFGQIIDLEKLERMGVNKNADELREKLAKEDVKRLKEVEDLQSEVIKLKEQLTEVTKNNTTRLERLVDLTDTKQNLEESLNAAQLSVTAEYSGPQHREIVERQHLVTLVQTQAQEIEDLKREIEMLIRKPMRQLPPIARGRAHISMGPTTGDTPKGGMVTGQGMMMAALDARSMPATAETVGME